MNRLQCTLVLAFCLALLPGSCFAQDRVEKLLEELTNAPGVSGQEAAVRHIVTRELRDMGAQVSFDGLGSVIGVRGNSGPRIMLAAHMDEVGLVVKYITTEGYVKFHPLGGWLDQALVDKRWIIQTSKGPLPAVSGVKSVHLSTAADKTTVFSRDALFLDVGARSKQEAEEMGIVPGDAITPDVRFMRLGSSRAYTAKALDDRLGLTVMLEVLRRLGDSKHPNTICAVGTVQEETGSYGAQASARIVKPDIAIAIDVGLAADYPGVGPDDAQERAGAGPALWLEDSGMSANRKLRDFIVRAARDKGIPLQFALIRLGFVDASEMQRWSTGTPAINLSVPVRYLHSFNSVTLREDTDKAIELLVEVLQRLDAKTVEELKRFE